MLLSDLLEKKPALERERAFSMCKAARAPFPAFSFSVISSASFVVGTRIPYGASA